MFSLPESEEVPLEPSGSLSNQRFEYRGDLAHTALPEILYSVDRFQVPGIIEVGHEEVVKKVYVKGGTVIHASSTDLDDSLGAYLLRTGILKPGDYRRSMEARRNSSRRYGVVLIELGFLSPAEVYTAIRKQIEAIVWSLFTWREGTVRFQIGEFPGSGAGRIRIPMRQVILQGIKKTSDAKLLASRLGGKETVFKPSFHGESLIESALEAEDLQLLRLVDGRRTLYEVCTAGPYSVPENAKVMYAFRVMQLIREAGDRQGGADGGAAEDGSTASETTDSGERRAIKIRIETPGGTMGDGSGT